MWWSAKTARLRSRPTGVCFGCAVVAAFLSISCAGCTREDQSNTDDPRHPASLHGAWVRVYPYAGGLDTLILSANGNTVGPVTAIDVDPIQRISRWVVGGQELCLSNGAVWVCAGYELRGDTLVIANGDDNVLVRPRWVTSESLAQDSAANDDRARFGKPAVAPKPPGGGS